MSLRGIRSASGDNQPLYVIDGVPMLNIGTEQAYSAIGGTANAGNRDGGDGISNLNPEDVESISILKGAPAAALYGSQAAERIPRRLTFAEPPIPEEFLFICTPAALPARAVIILTSFIRVSSSPFTF